MKLPNGQAAIVDVEKLQNYCLNPDHPRGRHKARLFEVVLGLTSQDAPTLKRFLLEAAAKEDAVRSESDAYGDRY